MTALDSPAAPGGLLDHLNATAETGRTLPGRRARVVLADGTELRVRITNREYIAWDKTAPRHKWGAAQDVPFLAQSFLAFAAAKRDSLYTGSFDAFQNEAELIEDVKDEDEVDVIRPTRTGLLPDSP